MWSVRGVDVVLVGVLLLSAPAPVGADGDETPFGCESVAGDIVCPDLLIDPARALDMEVVDETYDAASCEVQAGYVAPGDRRLLRFSFASVNLGDGDLVIGAPDAHPDRFEENPCHGHGHLLDYAHYRVWQHEDHAVWAALRALHPDMPASELLTRHPELADGLVEGAKVGFCARDTRVYVPGPPRFTDCDVQGITWGWADEYPKWIPLQFVDVTGVPPGGYVLELEVNPERVITETHYRNNAVALSVVLDG